MIKKHFIIRLLAAVLAAVMFCCTGVTAFAEDDMEPYRTGSPWICSNLWGTLTEDIVSSTGLKDDFYTAVNGEKILHTEFAPGYNQAGTMLSKVVALDKEIEDFFINRIDDADAEAQLAYDYYDLYMDWEGRNAAGVAPLKEETDAVEAMNTVEDLIAYMAEVPFTKQVWSLFSVGTTESFEDSNKKVIYVDVIPGLLLDDSAEYSNLTEYGALKKEAYTELIEKMLLKLGYSQEETAAKTENAFTFDSLTADLVYTVEEQNSPDIISKMNNHFTREELAEISGKLPVLEFIEDNIGMPEADDYLVVTPALFERVNDLMTEENLTLIKDNLIVHAVLSASGILDRECFEWNTECSNKIRGVSESLEDSVIAAGIVASNLEWAVARLYTAAYLKQEDKDRISDLVDAILRKYVEVIQSADFLSDETKAASIEKLQSISKKVLWPDDWSKYTYEGLEMKSPAEGGLLYNELNALGEYSIRKMIKEYSEPKDPDKWLVSPQTFNCMYSAQGNEVYILGAFATGEIYNSAMSDEELYGSIGAVIGHEISHAFDSTGAQFDKDGNMNIWWNEDDIAAFSEKNNRLIDYLGSMYPWEGQEFIAGMYSGEACADMGGIKVMLLLAAEKENFDYDAFFRAYANLWIRVRYIEGIRNALLSDPHPLEYIRVNTTLQQFDEFLDFYGIKEGDGMYLAPEDRVKIW